MRGILRRIFHEDRADGTFLLANRHDEQRSGAIGLHRNPVDLRGPTILGRIGYAKIFAFLQGCDEMR